MNFRRKALRHSVAPTLACVLVALLFVFEFPRFFATPFAQTHTRKATSRVATKRNSTPAPPVAARTPVPARSASARTRECGAGASMSCRRPVGLATSEVVSTQDVVWLDRDIGNVQVAGGTARNGDIVVVAGAGVGLSHATSDQLHFSYRTVTGDVDIVARLREMDDAHPLAAGGIMIRGSLDADASYAALTSTALFGVSFSRRLARGWTPDASVGSPSGGWLKLERRGSLVTAFASQDGTRWEFMGSDDLPLDDSIHVGLFVSSHQAGTLATAVFDRVELTSVGGPGSPDVLPQPIPAPSPIPPPAPEPAPEPAPTPTPPAAPEPQPEPTPEPSPIPALPPILEPVPTPAPVPEDLRYLVFKPSPDHDTGVTAYLFEVALAGSLQTTVLQRDIGKPAIVNGECRVDVSALLSLLPTGSYVAVVRAAAPTGPSAPGVSAPFSR